MMAAGSPTQPAVTLAQALQRAEAAFNFGRWSQAEECCRAILRVQSQHMQALNLLGIIAAQTQRLEEAERLLRQAALTDSPDAAVLSNHGGVLRQLGRIDEALHSYAQALALQPLNAQTHYNRGLLLRQVQRLDEAIGCFERAAQIEPSYAEAHYHLGLALLSKQLPEPALVSLGRAVALRPNDAECHFNRALALQQLRQLEEASAGYRHTLSLRPDLTEAYYNLGAIQLQLQRYEEALASFERTVKLAPDYADGHNKRALMLLQLRRFPEAVAGFDRALQLDPQCVEAHSNRGVTLLRMSRFEEAERSYRQALSIDPKCANVHVNIGVLCYDRNQPRAAIAHYARAIELSPDFPTAYLNRAHAYLLAGDFTPGWADFEWRWKIAEGPLASDTRFNGRPLWLGDEPIAGRSILLHAEQGLGDTLQFCRYVRLVVERGARVLLEVPDSLVTLMRCLPGVDQVFAAGEPLPAFDLHCPLLSLPLAFRTTLATIPASVPYLGCDADLVRIWRARLGERRKLRVGLVWSGGTRPGQPECWTINAQRNLPPALLASLPHEEIELFSLQKGQSAQAEWQGPPLRDFTHLLTDFSETAALMENLDLVISVDTSMAHLAGALGKPVWILNRFNTCWRWLLDRSDSPWYPSATIYRQRRPGDWYEVVARVRQDLHALLRQHIQTVDG
jgi:tetratricopeptide (TPR) repeat protein